MSVKRLAAILFIFASTAIAWFVLGASIIHRTENSRFELTEHVSQLWGGQHAQAAPSAWYWRSRSVTRQIEETDDQGRTVTRDVEDVVQEKVAVPLSSSTVAVDLELEHRKKGLLWHDTYSVRFRGRFTAHRPEAATGPLEIHFSFPSPQAIYDGFEFVVDGRDVGTVADLSHGVSASSTAGPGEQATFEIGYSSRGLDHWSYLFAPGAIAQIRNFTLSLGTDFDDVDFLPGGVWVEAGHR